MKRPNITTFISKEKLLPGINRLLDTEKMKIFSRLPIRYRLIMAFLFVSIVPIFIMGLVSYHTSRNAIMNKVATFSGRELDKTYYIFNSVLNKYSDFATSILLLTNKDLRDQLEKLTMDIPDNERFDLEQNLKKIFHASFTLDSGLTVAFYPANDKKVVFYGNDIGLEKFKTTSLYQKAKSQTVVWDNYGQKIVYVKELSNINAGKVFGKIAFFIDESNLDDIVNQTLYNESDFSAKKITQYPYSIAINEKGIIILSPFKDDLGKNISTVAGKNLLKRISTTKGANVKLSDKIKQKNVLVTYTKLDSKGWYLLNIAPNSFLYSEMNLLVWGAFLIGILLCAIATVISFGVSLGISNPLDKVKQAMHLAENGDLSVKVNIPNQDELGELGRSFNLMMDKIRVLIADTQTAVTEVLNHSKILKENSAQSAQTAEAVSLATGEITKGTTDQTQEAERASQRMTELANQIEAVVLKSNEVEQFSAMVRKMSVESKNVVLDLMHKAKDTGNITNTVIHDIHQLSSSASEIRTITEAITNIAEQSNLLALNAAIEAARAGEMGLGFAVVAEEINKLAAQSQVSAKTINGILKEIQAKSDTSSQTALTAHKIVEEQLLAVQKAQKSFDEIIVAVDKIVDRMSEVNENIHEINTVKENTISSIMNISAISEETAASTEEVSASTEEQSVIAETVSLLALDLLKRSDKLVASIAKFKVSR